MPENFQSHRRELLPDFRSEVDRAAVDLYATLLTSYQAVALVCSGATRLDPESQLREPPDCRHPWSAGRKTESAGPGLPAALGWLLSAAARSGL